MSAGKMFLHEPVNVIAKFQKKKYYLSYEQKQFSPIPLWTTYSIWTMLHFVLFVIYEDYQLQAQLYFLWSQ